MLVYVLRPGGPSIVSRFLRSRAMVATGKYSYALYLIHLPVALAVQKATAFALGHLAPRLDREAGYMLFFTLTIAIAWIASFASWHLFEKHFLNLKRHFSYS